MKNGWEIKKLSDVCSVIAGQSPEGKYYNTNFEGLPFYQGKKEFKDKHIGEPTKWTTKVTKEAIAGDILMSVRAPVGPVNFATQKICIGRGLAAIRATESIENDYLFYYFIKHENEIVGNEGAVFNSINKTQIENLNVPIPPIPEQKRIVKILDEAFAAIDKAKANAEKNLQNSRELFDSYLNKVFAPSTSSGQRNPGEDWEKKKLGKICDFVRGPFGGSLKKQIFVEDGYAVFEQSHAIYNQFEKIRYFINSDKFKEMSRFEVRPGNLIMSCSGTMGKVSIVPDGVKQGIINQALLLLKPKGSLFNKFLKYWIESDSFQESLKMYSQGAAIQNVASVKTLKEIQIHFPSLPIQKKIVKELDEISSESKKLEAIYQQKLINLEKLKKSILQKAFDGEL